MSTRLEHFLDSSAAFLENHNGDLAVLVEDANIVRSDAIVIHQKDRSVHAVMEGADILLGTISREMLSAFERHMEVLVSGVRADSRSVDLRVPVVIRRH